LTLFFLRVAGEFKFPDPGVCILLQGSVFRSEISKIHIFTHLTPFFLGVAVVIFGGGMFSSSDTSGLWRSFLGESVQKDSGRMDNTYPVLFLVLVLVFLAGI
jgi:hypothetical protein